MILYSPDIPHAMKSQLDQFLATNRDDLTDRDLVDLQHTSVLAYRASEWWAANVETVGWHVKRDDKILPKDSDHPLCRLVYSPNFQMILANKFRTEAFWGYDLVMIQRSAYGDPIGLRWINPNLYTQDTTSGKGLRGFRIHRWSSNFEPIEMPEHYIPRMNAWYTNGFSFDDEYDGTAPAEVAFSFAATEPAMGLTLLSTFRNNGMPPGIIQPAAQEGSKFGLTEGPDDETRNKLLAWLRQKFQGAKNAGKMWVSRGRWEYVALQQPWKDMAFDQINPIIREYVAIAFGLNLEFLIPDATNRAELEGKIDLWEDKQLKPVVVRYGHSFTEQVAHQFGEEWSVEPDLSDILKEDETEKLAIVGGKLDRAIITLYQAQKDMGVQTPEESFKNLYMIDGIPMPAEQVSLYWKHKLLVAPSVYNAEEITGKPLPQPVDPDQVVPTEEGAEQVTEGTVEGGVSPDATLPSIDASKGTQSACILLPIEYSADLVALRNRAAQIMGDIEVEWNAPDTYHITLAYIPDADDSQVKALADGLQRINVPELKLNIGSLSTFDDLKRNTVHFNIRRNADLLDLHQQIVDLCNGVGCALSQYSEPDLYNPHITFGYTDAKPPKVTYHSKLVVTADRLHLTAGTPGVEDDEVIAEVSAQQAAGGNDVPLPPALRPERLRAQSGQQPRAFQASQTSELARWKRAAVRNIKKARRFECAATDPDLAERIRQHLETLPDDADSDAIKSLFAQARLGRLPNGKRRAVKAAHNGVMVAVFIGSLLGSLIVDEARAAGMETLPPEELHLTLAYLGDADKIEVDRERLKEVLNEFEWQPVRGQISGVGRFNTEDGGRTPVYASFDSPDLPALRQALVEHLEANGIPYSTEHGFQPHITLGYINADAETPDIRMPPHELMFSVMAAAWGDERSYFAASPAAGNDARAELDRWWKAPAETKSVFEIQHLPQHIVDFVKSQSHSADAFPEAARRLGIKAIQSTRLDFENGMADILDEALAGNLTRQRFTTILGNHLDRYGQIAFRDGLIDGGVLDGVPDEDDRAVLDRLMQTNRQYARDLAAAVYSGQVSAAQAALKPSMWFGKSILPLYNAGLASANENAMFEFAGSDGAESCTTCIILKGQRHRMKDWIKARLRPQEDTDNFECGGWQCEHILAPTRERERGALPVAA